MDGIRHYDELMAKLNTLTGPQLTEVAIKSAKVVAMAQTRAAKLLAPVSPDGGSELRSSIHSKTEKDSGGVTAYCYTDSDHAAFVEFGTGPIGEAAGGNGSETKVSYTHGPFRHVSNKGKVYYSDYWIYRDVDGKFHATRGMEAQPFMYPSAMAVKKQAPKIQAEVLKRYLKGLGGA